MSAATEIKFQETLASLIAASPFKGNRKPIWSACHITSAALSQYIKGESRPRLETLVLLAEFFGVSVDYLLLGTDRAGASTSADAFNSYVDQALSQADAKNAKRAWMVGRITDALGRQVDSVANRLASDNGSRDGVIIDDDLLLLETFSRQVKVVANTLSFNVMTSTHSGRVSGRFATVVASNLKRQPQSTYQFLLSKYLKSAPNDVQAFRSLMTEKFGLSQHHLDGCEFRQAVTGFFAGSGFYRLDAPAFRRENPVLAEMLDPFITDEGYVGYVTHFGELKHTMLYATEFVSDSLLTFDELWSTAKKI